VSLSIKALEIAEEKEAVAAYGSSDSGASLGDILGAALKEKASTKTVAEPKAEKAEPKAKKAKAKKDEDQDA
jgi:small subunit ribosomal protein S1